MIMTKGEHYFPINRFQINNHMFMMFIGMIDIINVIDPSIWSEVPCTAETDSNNGTLSG